MTAREKGWLATIVVLAVLALIELFYIPGQNYWFEALNNVGHLPVFALLAIAVLHLVKRARPALRSRPLLAYGIALFLAAALGAASEGIQYFGPRDADLGDLVRDVVGATCGLALYAAVRDRDLRETRRAVPRLGPALWAISGLLLLAGSWTFLSWSAAYAHRWWQLPVLCDFDSRLSTRFLEPHHTRLEHNAKTEDAGYETHGTRMVFERSDWPGVEIVDVYPDWTDHDSLLLHLTVEGDRPLLLAISVTDRDHNQTREDRFSMGIKVDPGQQKVGAFLGTVFMAPKNRNMDGLHMKSVRIFSDSSSAGRSVLLERLELK